MTEPKKTLTMPKGNFLSFLQKSIITGLFITVPVIITLWFGWWTISLLTDWAVEICDLRIPDLDQSDFLLIRLLTILAIILVILQVGMLTRMTIGQRLIDLMQKLLLKIPILRIVYSTCEQIGETVKTQQGGLFKQVALFEYPRKGCWAVGFVTSNNTTPFEITDKLPDGDVYSIFMPTTPNPTSGFLMYIPKKECIILEMSVGEAMRLIVSGGVILPGTKLTIEE